MPTDGEYLLELENWSLARRGPAGDEPILNHLNLRLRRGVWLAVLGANGSGKSSLLRFLAGEESPLEVSTAIMFQDPDDQMVAATVGRELTLGRPERDIAGDLHTFGLAGREAQDPRLLSAGQKQRLALAVALGGEPQLLLADEPTALQDPRQAEWILGRLDQWRHQGGRTLVSATCDRREAALADEILLLEEGRVVLHGPSEELIDHPRVVALVGDGLGTPAVQTHGPGADGEVVSVVDLECRFGGRGGGFHLPELRLDPGARLGITGSNGSGKSTLLAILAGARRPEGGRVRIMGQTLYEGRELDLEHGLAMLAPQFPEYLFTRETVAAELAVDPALAGLAPEPFLEGCGLPVGLASRNPHSLSSGQRRRLALGLVLGSGRPLLLLDEPTAALDRSGRATVFRALEALPEAAALVIASHDRGFLARAGCAVLDLDDYSLAAGGGG